MSAVDGEAVDAAVAAMVAALAQCEEDAGPIAWHWGMCDASGFAAMGTAEVLVHTFDITQGLGVAWLPPDSLSEGVVARLLPDLPPGPPAQTLLWSTGRAVFEGRPPVTDWVWRPGR